MQSIQERSVGMSDGEKIVLYTIKHALASQTVDIAYLMDELDFSVGRVIRALDRLIERKLIVKRKNEYELSTK